MTNGRQGGFTLIEIAIVLMIVTILLGYTVALFPRQQELKQYRDVERKMDEVIVAIVGFAQINGRLPCPAIPDSAGIEDFDTINDDGCDNFGGFVPINTLGLGGRLNADSLLLDPWGNPYRYYVTDSDFDVDGFSDFTAPNGIRTVNLVDQDSDGFIDLDGQFVICDQADATLNDHCDVPANFIFGDDTVAGPPYAGAPFVLISHGKNWNEGAAAGDELVNMGATLTTALGMVNGPTLSPYLLKDVSGVPPETTFVRRVTGFADDFDDVVIWVSPNILFSKMIEAGQLP